MSEANKGKNNPMFGKTGKTLSEEMKARISATQGTAVKVMDIETNETITYSSINRAAEALGISQQRLSYQFKKNPLSSFVLKGRYQIEKVIKDL